MSAWILLVRQAAQAYPNEINAVHHIPYTVNKALALGLIKRTGTGRVTGNRWCHLYRATDKGLAFAEGRMTFYDRPGKKPTGRPTTALTVTWLHARPQFTHSQWEAVL